MKALVTGWCPKHDRIYERADRCPECGTTLVPIGAPKPAVPSTEHRETLDIDAPNSAVLAPTPSRNPWRNRAAVAAAIVVAFVLGLVFPRADRQASNEDAAFAGVRDRTPVVAVSEIAGKGSIELVSLRQSGEQVHARFRALAGFPDPTLIQDASLGVTVRTATSSGTPFGLSDVGLAATPDGFTVTGRLDAPGDIVEIRILSIQVREEHAPEWRADVSSIWPTGKVEPRVLRVIGQSIEIADGTVGLVALLAWSDRIDAVFELRGAGGEPGNLSEIGGLEMLVTPARMHRSRIGGVSITASRTDQISAGQLMARFEGVPGDAEGVIIRATRLLIFAGGPWVWRLT